MTYNFSEENKKALDLAYDLFRCDYSQATDGLKVKDLEEHLRKTIKEDILGGRTLYQAYRANKNVIFEIIEEIVNLGIGEGVLNSPFIDRFVEVKNRNLGDDTAFYSEGGTLVAAKFAGNHWDTDRQKVAMGSEITLPSEWIYVNVYDELERFLKGIVSLDKLADKVYKAINKYITDRIYAQFANVATAVPADFSASGNDEDAVGELVDIVQAAGGYDNVTIAGTKAALRKLARVVPDKMFANSQKEAKAMTGSIAEWEGNDLFVIPQTLKSGTFELALPKDKLFILGGDARPIKLEFIGDTRTKEDDQITDNNDQTLGLQVQTKMGIGLVLPEYFGVFTFVSGSVSA
jgi:hypothetical protein